MVLISASGESFMAESITWEEHVFKKEVTWQVRKQESWELPACSSVTTCFLED
jgi:hypothetical protein